MSLVCPERSLTSIKRKWLREPSRLTRLRCTGVPRTGRNVPSGKAYHTLTQPIADIHTKLQKLRTYFFKLNLRWPHRQNHRRTNSLPLGNFRSAILCLFSLMSKINMAKLMSELQTVLVPIFIGKENRPDNEGNRPPLDDPMFVLRQLGYQRIA